ncbi:hypothetical protein Tco_1162208 [Tanacetum coccineum]
MIIPESNSTYEFTNKVDEMRALPDHVLGAARVQILEDDLNDLKWTREEDGADRVFVTTVVESSFLGGTTIVELIIVKGHVFPSIVNFRRI